MAKIREQTESQLANLKPFVAGKSGNPKGRPIGAISLETRIRNLLEGDELPKSLKDAIRAQCGGDKKAIDAMIMVGMLQAIQGDANWFKAVIEQGYGKPLAKVEQTGKDGGPEKHDVTIRWADE